MTSESEDKLALAEMQSKLMKAAEIGRDLLQKQSELQMKLDEAEQDKHELTLKLEAKAAMEEAWQEELEHLRDTIR